MKMIGFIYIQNLHFSTCVDLIRYLRVGCLCSLYIFRNL